MQSVQLDLNWVVVMGDKIAFQMVVVFVGGKIKNSKITSVNKYCQASRTSFHDSKCKTYIGTSVRRFPFRRILKKRIFSGL